MRIAVASGKGGTGKTTIAVALALAGGDGTVLLDCDVEEPNCHLFIRPEQEEVTPVHLRVPEIDPEVCRLCGRCAAACEFGALAAMPQRVLVFPDLCHGCGACSYVCPSSAIREMPREIGQVLEGDGKGVHLVRGLLKVGEAQAPPVIREVMRHAPRKGLRIIDAPPGSSCPMVAATREADFVLFVTELTPFGLNDLRLAMDAVESMGRPAGIIVNRKPEWYPGVPDLDDRAPVMLCIPESRQVAETCARGGDLFQAMPELRPRFEAVLRAAERGEACPC